jgi:predicted RecA/RadA family phage recombinase
MKNFKFLAAVALAVACVAVQAAGVDIMALMSPEAAMGLTMAGAALSTNYVQEGDVIQYTAGGTITAGSVVVMGNKLGVALVDMVSGQTGSVAMRGVYTLPKVTGAVIAQGDSLTWDVSAGNFDDNAATPASGDITGAAAYAFEAAGAGVLTIDVCLTGAPGTKTA